MVVAPDGLTIWFARQVVTTGDTDIFVATRTSASDDWRPPTLVTELNGSEQDLPCAATADGLRLVMSSRRIGNTSNLFMTTRANAVSSWQPPLLIDALNAYDSDDPEAWVSPNALEVYFASNRPGGAGSYDIYRSGRATIYNDFDPPQPLGAPFNTTESDSDPWLASDRRYIMFSRGVPGSRDIYDAYREE